jgi:hypothetical protein
VKRLGAVLQEVGDPLEVIQQPKLSRRIIPFARVIMLDPRGQGREGLDLDLVRPSG